MMKIIWISWPIIPGNNFIVDYIAETLNAPIYKIDEILSNGDLVLKDARYQGGIEEDV